MLLVLILLWPLGQIARSPTRSYPLDTWAMYTLENPPQAAYEFMVTRHDGRRAPFDFRTVSPWVPGPRSGFSTLGPVAWKLVKLRAMCACQRADRTLDAEIEAVLATEADPQRRVAVFEIVRVDFDIRTRTRRSGRVQYQWASQPLANTSPSAMVPTSR